MWYQALKDYLLSINFGRLESDYALFMRRKGKDLRDVTLIHIYVDDFIIIAAA